jgi:broad specificity phosphatase PhoE
VRLTFLCVAATPGLRRGVFPADEQLDERGLVATRAYASRLPPASLYWMSPAAVARQSAEALDLTASPVTALRECDYGKWAGVDLHEIGAQQAGAYSAWLSDPATSPPGGESIVDVIGRVGGWLDGLTPSSEDALAITHASVVRAAIVHARALPASAYARTGVAPLTLTAMRRGPVGWTVESIPATPGA